MNDIKTATHPASGGYVERHLEHWLFSSKKTFLAIFTLATMFFAYQLSQLEIDTDFRKMLPQQHSYIENMMTHLADIGGSANFVDVVVETTQGDIFSKEYMEVLRNIHDELFYIRGVNRTELLSLWSPAVRWIEVSPEGFIGGAVIPNSYDGTPDSIEMLKNNVLRSGRVGSMVADNFKSTKITVGLLKEYPDTAKPIDFYHLSTELEKKIREKYSSDTIRIHIVGVAKMIGELTSGGTMIVMFFAIAMTITFVLLFIYSRCLKSTVVPLLCSLLAVVWQLGLLRTLGYGLNPYSMLVPFLIFAIGMSHGVQVINAIAVGADTVEAKEEMARMAFRSLCVVGVMALLSDAVGFLTLFAIDIAVIQELGLVSAIGMAVIMVTNLLLLPVIMSYVGVSKRGIAHMKISTIHNTNLARRMAKFTTAKYAIGSMVAAAVLAAFGLHISKGLKIGDLDKGEPMLHPDSVYNKDVDFLNQHYAQSSDTFVVLVETEHESCSEYENMEAIDRFEWEMANVEGVQSTMSLAKFSKLAITATTEGNLKWSTLPRDQAMLNGSFRQMPSQLMSPDCSFAPVVLFLDDHKAETLDRITAAVARFAEQNNTNTIKFKMAAGTAGIEAATNQEIAKSQTRMLVLVYSVVSCLLFVTFRSIASVICIIVPLVLTSILCQALMSLLGIGVKVATLPVIALGVGIGVDYGIYVYSRFEAYLKQGMALSEAYNMAFRVTGKAVAFTGATLAVGVFTWIFSPIKFQADMGILLTFMFLWNMIGTLWLLPALAFFLVDTEKFAPRVVD